MSAVRKDLRHRARETALQILYAWDVGHTDIDQAVDTFFNHQWVGEGPSDEVRQFATELARQTVNRLDTIDPLIAETTERWRPERMAVLDRLILRMAVCELLQKAGTPAPVIINEALELARTFSTEDAVKFINGMLDGVRKKIEQ
jgi:N utilization substance protein B